MKINQLSKITGVNTETIRMYRNLGLLKPVQLPNGYYDYSTDDMRNLLHIRKLRGAGLGLDNVRYMATHDNLIAVYDALQEEYDALSEQIAALQREQFMLKLTMDHFRLYKDNPSGPVELEVEYDSYSIFPHGVYTDETVDWIKQMNLMTQSLRIPPEILLSSKLPDTLPIEIGVGTYKNVIDENNLKIPSDAVCIPKGKYLTVWVTPETDHSISRNQILPLIEYAKEHGYRLTGDSTAFMYRVDHSGKDMKFIYRFRARVEKAR